MRFCSFVFGALLLAFVIPGHTADINGYDADYECRANSPACNVDVAQYAASGCQQTITTQDSAATISSKLNGAGAVICVQAGDYLDRGAFTITTSGSAGAYRVLRYVGGNDNDTPWSQAASNQARMQRIQFRGASYWIVDRITFPPSDQSNAPRIELSGNAESHIILNRLLVEGPQSGFSSSYAAVYVFCCSTDWITVQNSVIRNSWGKTGTESMGIEYEDGTNMHIVNNELYDWSAHPIQVGRNEGPVMAGFVIENNDVYMTSAMYTSGGKSRGKALIAIKAGATAANPGRVVHNRVWGGRGNDLSVCCIVGDAVGGIEIVPPTSGNFGYLLIQNNIIAENQTGVIWTNGNSNHQSVIGNIFYKMRAYDPNVFSNALAVRALSASEVYLNSFIDNEQRGLYVDVVNSTDVKCNAHMSGGSNPPPVNNPYPSDLVMDHQAFYDTQVSTLNGSNSNIVLGVKTRAQGTAYAQGDILRTGAPGTCNTESDSGCYLYQVTGAGVSDGSTNYCTTLGCTMTDGSVSLRAIRGPYAVRRKLRTGSESYTIPYARVHVTAPEARACPTDYASRPGIGISDES